MLKRIIYKLFIEQSTLQGVIAHIPHGPFTVFAVLRMKRLLLLGFCLLLIPLLPVSAVPTIAVDAGSPRTFYAIGLDYKVYDELTTLTGTIATVLIETEGYSTAGIEQDIRIKTEDGNLLVEITNWYYGFTVGVGVVVFKDGEYWFGNGVFAQMGEVYSYEVTINDGTVYATIWDSQGQVTVHQEFGDDAQYIENTASYIEYWRIEGQGSFFYYGYVTIDNTEQLQYRDDFYHKSKGLPFGFYLIHHNWGGITDKGEVDDR